MIPPGDALQDRLDAVERRRQLDAAREKQVKTLFEGRRQFGPLLDRTWMDTKNRYDLALRASHPLYAEFLKRKQEFDSRLDRNQYAGRWKQSFLSKLPRMGFRLLFGNLLGKEAGKALFEGQTAKDLAVGAGTAWGGVHAYSIAKEEASEIIWDYTWEQFMLEKRVEAELIDGPTEDFYRELDWYVTFDPKRSQEEKELDPNLVPMTETEKWYGMQLLDGYMLTCAKQDSRFDLEAACLTAFRKKVAEYEASVQFYLRHVAHVERQQELEEARQRGLRETELMRQGQQLFEVEMQLIKCRALHFLREIAGELVTDPAARERYGVGYNMTSEIDDEWVAQTDEEYRLLDEKRKLEVSNAKA